MRILNSCVIIYLFACCVAGCESTSRQSTVAAPAATFASTAATRPTAKPHLLLPGAEIQSIDRLPMFRSIQVKGDHVYLETTQAPEEFLLCLNGKKWTQFCDARVGDCVYVQMMHVIGAGSRWFDVLDIEADSVVLRENYWFYGIMSTEDVWSVRSYADRR